MFERTDTEEVCYKIKHKLNFQNSDNQVFSLLGTVIAKAIFERIPLNAVFDRGVTRFLLEEDCNLEDISLIDKGVIF